MSFAAWYSQKYWDKRQGFGRFCAGIPNQEHLVYHETIVIQDMRDAFIDFELNKTFSGDKYFISFYFIFDMHA